MNAWLAATLKALYVLGLGYALTEFGNAQISWIFIAIISIFAFFLQLSYSRRKQNKVNRH